jgi:hypothetical protein
MIIRIGKFFLTCHLWWSAWCLGGAIYSLVVRDHVWVGIFGGMGLYFAIVNLLKVGSKRGGKKDEEKERDQRGP